MSDSEYRENTMTEDQLEREALGWLQEVGYAHCFGPDIAPDEVYINIVYNGKSTVPISDVIGDVASFFYHYHLN